MPAFYSLSIWWGWRWQACSLYVFCSKYYSKPRILIELLRCNNITTVGNPLLSLVGVRLKRALIEHGYGVLPREGQG